MVTDRVHGRLVYSTGTGRVCPGCGWPADNCRCSKLVEDDRVPARIVAKLRIEKKGRGGKTVTVVTGFVGIGQPEKERLAKEIQQACGAGGTVKEGRIEIQGDQRETVARIPAKAGFGPLLAGG